MTGGVDSIMGRQDPDESMRISKIKDSDGYIPRNKYFFAVAVAAAVILVLAFVFNVPETTELYYVEADLYAFWIVDIILFWCSSRSLYIDENGITVFRFGIRTRYVPWSNVEQVGTGHATPAPSIVIMLKGGKKYMPNSKSFFLRNADNFGFLHPKSCIVIESYKADKARPLIKKYYGDFDFECNS